MKMFTLIILVLIMSLPVFSEGQSEEMMDEKDKMEAPVMMAPSPLMEFQGMEDAMMLAESKPTVLFFKASWCPSCQAATREFEASPEKLNGINLLFVDYDNSDDLQKKYGVTYQHTFVQINPQGEAVNKWNGGGIEEILMKTEMKEM